MNTVTRSMVSAFVYQSGDIRPEMQGVYLDKEKGYAVATDGHKLIYFKHPFVDMALESCIVPVEVFPKREKDEQEVEFHPGKVQVNHTKKGYSVIYRCIEKKYPLWFKVIPTMESREIVDIGHIGLSPNLLAAFGKWDNGIVIRFYTGKTMGIFPLDNSIGTTTPETWKGLLMPCSTWGIEVDDLKFNIETGTEEKTAP